MTDLEQRRRGRSGRDWLADSVLFLAAVAYAAAWYVALLDDPAKDPDRMTVLFVVATVACCVLWLRRRWPVAVAVSLIPVSVFDDLASGAMLVALFTVAIHRPVKTTALVCVARLLAMSVYIPLQAAPTERVAWAVAFTTASSVGVVGWGLFIRHRRQLLASLRERAARAEVEAELRTERAQHLAREEIAREMHDVLGHRLSLLSVHAGALEFHPHASPAEIARTAGVIRKCTHQALQDLRDVIGVLRAPVGELPQPTYADLPGLVDESVRAGTRVRLADRVDGDVPERIGRTAYRIVQEALTNARKHAPGAEVTVTIEGAPERGLSVRIHNTATDRPSSEPGSGQGLRGLADRAALVDGRLEYGSTADGGFQVSAWLPWPA